MSGSSGSGEACDLLQQGSPTYKGSEIIVMTTDTMATAASNQAAGTRSLEALFRVTDSELQTLSNRSQHKVKVVPRVASTVTRPVTIETSPGGTPTLVQYHVHEPLVPEAETSGKRTTPKKSKYACPYCGRVCAKPSVLQKHVRSHTNERPFPCQQCGFRFKTRSNLYKHQRSTSHQQRLPGSTETASMSVESSVEESFDSIPEPELEEEGNEEDQIIQDVEMVPSMVPSVGILGVSSAPLTLVDNDGAQIRTLIRDDDSVGVTVEYTRSDSLMRSSSLDRQTITTEMFSNRVDELISHNSKLLDKNIAPLQRRRLSRQNSDGRVESPRIILPSLVPTGMPPGTPGSVRSLSRQNSSLDTPLEDSVFHLPIATPTGMSPVIRFGNLATGNMQIIPIGRSQPGTPILLSPNQNILKVATPTAVAPGNVPILISPTQQAAPVAIATEGKASLKEKLKGHLLSRRLQRLQRESSTEGRSVSDPDPPAKRRLSRQVSMDTDDVIMTSMQSQESHDDVFVDLRDSVEVIVVNDDTPTPETLQIIQAPLAESVQILRTEDPLIDDVIILRDTTRPLLLLPTNQSLQIFIPGEPSLATNELGAWQNVNVVQSEPSTPVVISMIDETPDVDVQQLLLGHKYPSLRISTVTSFCTVLNLQPVYAPQSQGNQVSMYSKWRTARFNQNPLGLGTREFMSLYRSTHTSRQYSVAAIDSSLKITQSTVVQEYRLPRVSALVAPSVVKQTNNKFVKSASIDDPISSRKASKHGELRRTLSEVPAKPKGVEIFPGCIRSDEMYQYVRGRGRGRYVCQQCGIRCRKPSLLKKHFRAHTDLRPYICHACRFSFKTKGNLTKHMKSRYHSRKCHELGLLPVPTQVDDTQIDTMMLQLQMARGTSQDDDGDEDGDEVEEEEDEEIDVEGEVAVAGLERDMDHMDHMEDSELQIATDEIAAVSTVARASRRRSLPSSADVAMGTMRTPLLGDIMMGTDSRLSTVYGLSCDLLANEATLSEASLSPRSSPVAQSESVSQCSQNEAARSLLDLASRKDSPTSPIGQKRVEPNKTDSLIGQHPESIIRQESAPAGLIQPSQDGGQSHKTQIPTRLGTMYSSPPSPQHTKPRSDRDIPRAGFVPPLMQLGDKPAFSKALSLDLSKVNTYCAKRKNPKIVEVSPGGDERTLLTSSPSPEIQSRLTPEPVRLFVSSSQASESVPTAVKPTAIVAVSVPYVSTSPLVGHVRTVSVQSMSCLQSRSVTTVKASTATVPIARTLPQISGKSAIPRDSAQLLKSTQSVRELIRRLSSADSLDEPAETTSKRPAAVTRSDSLAKRPRLAEILSEDSSSRDSPRSSVELELSTRQRPANLVVQQPMAQMASPLASPMMMPYVVLQGQSTLQGQGSPLVLAQMPNLGMLGQSLLMQQPYLASSPMVTGAPATPPVMILSPSLVMDQSGQLTLSGGPQNFVFSPSPLVQPSSMFSTSALPIASPSPPMEHIIMETHTHVTMETHVARETASSPPVAMETCSTLSTSGSSSSSSSSTSVSESLPIEMTPMPGRVTTEVRNDDGRYKCQHCDKSFTHQHQLTLHKNIHAFERNYQCTECSLSFRSEYLLQKHKRSQIHHQKLTDAQMYGQASEENPRPFSCAECGVAFRIRGHLAKHMRSKQHLLRSDSELEEQGQSLQDEARSMSIGDDDVMGDVTPSVPSSRLDVGARRRRFASESDSFRRHVSDEDFDEVAIATTSTMTSVLSRALSTVAKSAVAIVSRSLSLDTSKRVAMNSETSSAAACRVNFSSRVTMTTSVAKPTQATIATSHGSRHEVLVYQCALCSRQFSSLTELEDHPCTGVAVVRNHVCDTCDAGFTSKSALDNHRLMHQPEQGLPFVCGICGQKFSQLGHLNTHVNSRHTGPSNRPWQRSPESVA